MPASVEPRLLRVVPDGVGGWWVRERRTGEVLDRAPTSDAALQQATRLLDGGGLVEVVDEGDFVVAKAYVPPPPVPWRTAVRRASLTVAVALLLALLVGWLTDFRPLPVVLGMALGAQAVTLMRIVRARRARREVRPSS